jgi:uncharacterized cupin superfamily protein
MTMASLYDPVFDDNEDYPGYAHRRARLGLQSGAEHLGASLYELNPGIGVCPYHWHAAEEEMLIVISGRPSMRTLDGWRELERGEVVSFPVGKEGAHQIINRSSEPVSVLLLSQREDPEVCGYPDSRKIMADAALGGFEPGPDGISHLWRLDDAVDYWEGEEPPQSLQPRNT